MEDRKYTVYKHTNKINSKSYIGITKQSNYKKRWGYGSGYIKQLKFYNAIKKYGWDNFTHEIVYKELSLEEACKLEKELIILYDAINNGYNINAGGELLTYEHSSSTIIKLKNLIWITNGIKNKRIDSLTDSVLNYPGYKIGYTITEKQKEYQRNRLKNTQEKKALAVEQWISEKHTCKTCGKIMIEYYGNGIYCCEHCARSHQHSEETKQLLAEMAKQGICGNLGKKFSEEHKQKIGKANKGKKRTDAYKEHLSKVNKGKIPWNKGKHMPEKRYRITNGVVEKNILEKDLLIYLNNGWNMGRLKKEKKHEL